MPNIREASFGDFKEIEGLKGRYGLENKALEEWRHLWGDNAVIKRMQRHIPMGWVLEDDSAEKRIVGYMGNIPLMYEFNGKPLVAAASTSFVVDAGYRNYSVMLAKCYFDQNGADLLLMTTSNYEAGRVYAAFKAKALPVDYYDMPLYWILNHRRFAASIFAKKKILFNRLLGYPLAAALWITDIFNGVGKLAPQPDEQVRYCSDFDGRFDSFWLDLRKKRENRLLRVRDRESLSRHFKYTLLNNKAWIAVFEKKSRMSGYAVFLRQDNPEIGLKRTRLVDLQYIDDAEDAIKSMVSSAVKRCREEGVHVLEILGFDSQKRSVLERMALRRRRLPNQPFFYKAKDEILARGLENSGAWDPCSFDGDGSV